MKPRIYIETSVVSYLTARPSQNIITAAQQIITRQWWTTAAAYDLCTSQLTLDEANNGDAEAASQRLSVLGTLPILTLDEDANARMRAQIEAVCRAAGFQPAVIGTPQELFLLGES